MTLTRFFKAQPGFRPHGFTIAAVKGKPADRMVIERVQIHRTPRGIAQDPWLTTPDMRIDARGQYKVSLLLPAEEAQPLIALVDEAIVASVVQARKQDPARAKRIKSTADKPYTRSLGKDGREAGDVSFRFSVFAKFTSKRTGQTLIQKPGLFDAKCRLLDPTKITIGDGSTVMVAFEILPFYMSLLGAGVSLRLRAVQVLNLVEPSDRDASYYGFAAEEGYEADDSLTAAAVSRRISADQSV